MKYPKLKTEHGTFEVRKNYNGTFGIVNHWTHALVCADAVVMDDFWAWQEPPVFVSAIRAYAFMKKHLTDLR